MTMKGHQDQISGLKIYKHNYLVSSDVEGQIYIFDIRNQQKVSGCDIQNRINDLQIMQNSFMDDKVVLASDRLTVFTSNS